MSIRKSTPSDSPRRQNHYADRISDLPDSILALILSLLPTKIAVSTSVLSTRWKLLWTTAFNLDFCCPQNHTRAVVGRFVKFVNYVLLLHKPGYFNKLSLTWKTGCVPFHVNTWISAAVARDVHELFVCAEISNFPIQVQSYLFSSETLQSLELNCDFFISSEIVFSLPRLEHLELISICFQSDEAFSKLLAGCPILKYLVIHMDIARMFSYDYDNQSFKCIISSTSLRHIELYVYDEEGSLFCDVQLDAPSLRYIKLKDRIYDGGIVIPQRFDFLDEAIIHTAATESISQDQISSLSEAFHAFGCAKTLTLSDSIIRALTDATAKMKTEFNRLTRLEVIIDWEYCSSLLDFIKLSDNLEVLLLYKDPNYNIKYIHCYDSIWKKPDLVPRCLSNSLKTVSIVAYDGHADELAIVDYILTHGSVLQVMQIGFGKSVTGFEKKYKLVQEISESPRNSRICKVEFRDRDS